MLQVILLQLRQRDKTLHHPLILDVNLRDARREKLISMLKHQSSAISAGLPCSIWGCPVYCCRQSGRLSHQTGCGPHTLLWRSRYKSNSGRTLINPSQSQHQWDRSRTCFHESCNPRLLAVAVVEEGHLPLLHLPHKITRLWSEVTRSAGDQGIKTLEGCFGMF